MRKIPKGKKTSKLSNDRVKIRICLVFKEKHLYSVLTFINSLDWNSQVGRITSLSIINAPLSFQFNLQLCYYFSSQIIPFSRQAQGTFCFIGFVHSFPKAEFELNCSTSIYAKFFRKDIKFSLMFAYAVTSKVQNFCKW